MRKAAWIAAILLLVVAGAAFLAYERLDVIVKVALEHYGPQVAGVSIDVGEVEISPRDGRGVLRRVDIGNPPGFSTQRAARLGEITVLVDPATVRAPVVLIHEISIGATTVTYEQGAHGTNLEAIQKHIAGYVKQAAEESRGAAKTPSGRDVRHRFIVERLVIHNAKVTLTNAQLKGQGVTFDLPDIELANLGKRQGGATASEIASTVADALTARIAQKLLTNFDLLRKGGVEGAIDALKALVR